MHCARSNSKRTFCGTFMSLRKSNVQVIRIGNEVLATFTSFLSVVQLKGKHCRKPHCCNGVVDTFEQCPYQLLAFLGLDKL